MIPKLNLHVMYWQECEVCGFDSSLDQDEAEEYTPIDCPKCTTFHESTEALG